MELQSLEEKQQFLRDEIIGKEMDAEAFMEFMGKVKNQGDNIDLDNWTLSELTDVIQQFKEYLSRSRQELLSSRISRDFRKARIFNPVKKDKVKYEGTALWDYEQRYEQECSKSELAFQLPPNLTPRVQISKWEIRSVGGFIFGIGARNELQLTIGSNFTASTVTRKDEDCDWLRNILVSKHAGSYVPPLEPSREFASDDKNGINARIEAISKFLDTVLNYPVFHFSPDLRVFLTQASYKEFTDHKTTESAIAIEKDLLEIDTPSGSFTVVVSEDLNRTIKESSRIADELNSLYGELSNCLNKVGSDLDNLTKSLWGLNHITGRIGEKFSEIQSILKHEQTKLPAIFLSINESSSFILANLKSQISSLSNFTTSFARPALREWNEFSQFTRRHQNQIKAYLSAKENLLKKKERYLMDSTKWELPQADFIRLQRQGANKLTKQESFERMFPGDNDKENRTRIWLSFVNQGYLSSFRQFLTEHQKCLLESYLTYTERQMNSGAEVMDSYVGFREMIGC